MPLGLYTVTVKNTDGSENTSTDLFGITNPTPAVTTITPTSAYNTSPVAVTISGTNFVSGIEVLLVNRSTSIRGTVSGWSPTKFTGTFALPGQPEGIYNLTVINPGVPNVTRMNALTVLAPGGNPSISSFSPTSGKNNAALPFTINGNNFRTGMKVTITNGTTTRTVTGTLTGQTKIACSLPLTGLPFGLYTISVTNTDGTTYTHADPLNGYRHRTDVIRRCTNVWI